MTRTASTCAFLLCISLWQVDASPASGQPVVDAGSEGSVYSGDTFYWIALVNEDEGKRLAEGLARAYWTVMGGPAEVGDTLSTAQTLEWLPIATGTYTLRFCATDLSNRTACDLLDVNVSGERRPDSSAVKAAVAGYGPQADLYTHAPPGATVLDPGSNYAWSVGTKGSEGETFYFPAGIHRINGNGMRPKSHQTFYCHPEAVLSGARALELWVVNGIGSWSSYPGRRYAGPAKGAHYDGDNAAERYPEELFFDDVRLHRVESVRRVGSDSTWYLDRTTGVVTVGVDPTGVSAELSTQYHAFYLRNGVRGVTIENCTIEKVAGPHGQGAIHIEPNAEDATLDYIHSRLNHGQGVKLGTGSTMRYSILADNGQYGVGGSGDNITFTDNEVRGNSTLGYDALWAAGASKLTNTNGLIFRRNYLHANAGPGIWTDINNINSYIEYNVVEDSYSPDRKRGYYGIHHEISYDAVVRGNTVRRGKIGIYVSTSGYTKVIGNHVADHTYAEIVFFETDRGETTNALEKWAVHDPVALHNTIVFSGTSFAGIHLYKSSRTCAEFQVEEEPVWRGTKYRNYRGGSSFKACGAQVDLDAWKAFGYDLVHHDTSPVVLYEFSADAGKAMEDVAGHADPLGLTVRAPGAVHRQANRGLLLRPAGQAPVASGRAGALVSALQRAKALTIEAWVAPAAPRDPGTVLALAGKAGEEHFALAQHAAGSQGSTFAVRLSTERAGMNRLTSLQAPPERMRVGLRQVVFTRAANGTAALYLDGEQVAKTRQAGTFANWSGSSRLLLGNRAEGRDPWAGLLHRVAIFGHALTEEEVSERYQRHAVDSAALLPEEEQLISLRPGWNTVASPLLLAEHALEDVLAGIRGRVVRVSDEAGRSYAPSAARNSLTRWQPAHVYRVYMSAPGTLRLRGRPLNPDTTPLALRPGWNQVPSLRLAPRSVWSSFHGILDDLLLVKNAEGAVFSPAYELDDIGKTRPGQGYFVYARRYTILLPDGDVHANTNSARHAPPDAAGGAGR